MKVGQACMCMGPCRERVAHLRVQGDLGRGPPLIRLQASRPPLVGSPLGLEPDEGGREALQPVGGQIELSKAAQASNLRGQSIQKVLREIEALQGG